MPQTALKEMINSLEADNFVGAAVAIEGHYENPFIISVLEDKASKKKDYVLEIAENLSSSYHDLDFDDDMQEAFAAAHLLVFFAQCCLVYYCVVR